MQRLETPPASGVFYFACDYKPCYWVSVSEIMRNLVVDFDLTIIWPLILLAVLVLWSAIYTYFRPSAEREYWRPSENRGHEFADNDAQRRSTMPAGIFVMLNGS